MYDYTAGTIVTPGGLGKFIEYNGNKDTVTVEHDYQYITEYNAKDCFVYQCHSLKFRRRKVEKK